MGRWIGVVIAIVVAACDGGSAAPDAGPDAIPPDATPPDGAPADPNLEAPPDIYTACQQQLGLGLASTKAPVNLFVIDNVEKPSEN